MADGDSTDSVDTSSSDSSTTQIKTTPDSEEAQINKDLFGGKAGDYTGVPKAAPAGTPESDTAGTESYLLKKSLEQYEKDRKARDEYNPQYEGLNKQLDAINARLAQIPSSNRPQYQQPTLWEQSPEYAQLQQKQKYGPTTMIAQVLSMVGIASAVFGKHRNPYASAALMNGTAGFINGFQKSRKDEAKNAMDLWNKNNELIHKQNQEETQSYRDVLADSRLDLQEKMSIMHEMAARKQDGNMLNLAVNRDLNGIIKQLQNKDKASLSFARSHVDVLQKVVSNWLEKTEKGKSWAAWVVAKTNGKVNPLSSTDAYMKAYNDEKLSPGAWSKEIGSSIDTEEKPAGTEQKTQGGTEMPHLSTDEEINSQPKGTVFIGPDGLQHIKNW